MLITLAIIGVAAALTIPTLIVSNQEKGWNTASKVFERKLEEATRVMNTQQTLAGYRTTKDFVNELRNHFKITKVCDTVTDCFEDKVYWGADNEEVDMSKIKTAKNFGQDDWDTEALGIQFANGTTGVIAYNPECRQDPYSNQITGTSCLALLYDTSGFAKPNTQGKDLRAINVNKLGNLSAYDILGFKFGTPFHPTYLTKSQCEAQKSKLGIERCYFDEDYMAGAIKTCKDQGGTLPSLSQLGLIADYFYNTTGIGSATKKDELTIDYKKVNSLGFNITDNSIFYIMSNEEAADSGRDVYLRGFSTSMTNRYNGSRSYNYAWAICITN